MTTIAVTLGVFNEEENISSLLQALLGQTLPPDEIIIVDDGSTDRTPEILAAQSARHPRIRHSSQANAGPAAARNRAWRETRADLCLFTDGDCVPDPDWAERLVAPFIEEDVGAAAGTYRTLNPQSLLARFIGDEIAWRYRKVGDAVDCHGTYNLAIRRSILEQLGGFNEAFRWPSGEDFDLTYRISRHYRIAFVREAVVGHRHPERIWWYLKNQGRRAFDRVRLYAAFPRKMSSDTYTGWIEKYQVLAAGLSLVAVPLALTGSSIGKVSLVLPLAFLVGTSLLPFAWFWRRSPAVALCSVPTRLTRNYSWLLGVVMGVIRHRRPTRFKPESAKGLGQDKS